MPLVYAITPTICTFHPPEHIPSEDSLRQHNLLLDAHTVSPDGNSQATQPACEWARSFHRLKKASSHINESIIQSL